MEKPTPLKKTSISVEENLWRVFGAELKLRGLEISEVLNSLIRDYLNRTKLSEGKTEETPPSPAGEEFKPRNQDEQLLVAALLLLLRDRHELASAMKSAVKSLLSNWTEKAAEKLKKRDSA